MTTQPIFAAFSAVILYILGFMVLQQTAKDHSYLAQVTYYLIGSVLPFCATMIIIFAFLLFP